MFRIKRPTWKRISKAFYSGRLISAVNDGMDGFFRIDELAYREGEFYSVTGWFVPLVGEPVHLWAKVDLR